MNGDIVLDLKPSPTNARNSEATFVTLKSGRILLIWSKFIGDDHSDFGSGVIAARWSDDGGRTWSDKDRVLVEKDPAATNVMSPSALRLQDGRIALLYLRKEGTRICMPLIRFSDDEAGTFSDPVGAAIVPGYYCVNNDRMIQLGVRPGTPREPRCDGKGLNARKDDEAYQQGDILRSPDEADAPSCRNPKGQAIFRPMASSLGLDASSGGCVSPSTPRPESASGLSRPRGVPGRTPESGRIIVPVCFCRWRNPSEFKEIERLPGDTKTHYPKGLEPCFASPTIIFCYFSDDGGRIWLESLTSFYYCFPDGSGLEEPGVVELADGRLWCYCRTGPLGLDGYGRQQWQSFSADQGQVWSPPEASQFVSPCSPMHVKRIPQTGHLLAIWNDHSGRFKVPRPEPISWARTPLVSAMSEDEGRSWRHHKLLEAAPDHGFCYPAIHFVEGAALLSYNAGGVGSRNPLDTQRVRRITLDELYRGD